MLLSEIINMSQKSELSSLAVKDDTPTIIQFINLGLLALYDKFALKTEEHVIELEDNKTIYDLPTDFMYLTGAFTTPPAGSNLNSEPLPINEESNPFSVNTINYRQVQIPLTVQGAYVGIIYVQKPEKLTESNLNEEVPIPDHLVQPLLHYVGYKAHGAIYNDGQQRESDVYYARFRRACDDLKREGTSIASDDLNMDTRLADRGFP